MTFRLLETSQIEANPAELYVFESDAISYQYTNHDADIVHPVLGVFTAQTLKRGSINQGSESNKNSLSIISQPDLPLFNHYRGIPLLGLMSLTIYKCHLIDFDAVAIWRGKVLGVELADGEATIKCEPLSVSLNRIGLHRLYSRSCAHTLYDDFCKVAKTAVAATVLAVDGVTVYLDTSLTSGHYVGGMLEKANGSSKLMILNNVGNELNLIYSATLEAGDIVHLYQGCDKQLGTCNNRFNNVLNFGGFPWMPSKNPTNSAIF